MHAYCLGKSVRIRLDSRRTDRTGRQMNVSTTVCVGVVSTIKLGDNLLFVGALRGQPAGATETQSGPFLCLAGLIWNHFTGPFVGSFIHSNSDSQRQRFFSH